MEEYNPVMISAIIATALIWLGCYAKTCFLAWLKNKLEFQQMEDARIREKEARIAAASHSIGAPQTPEAKHYASIQLLQKLLDLQKSVGFEDAEKTSKLEAMTLESLEHCHNAFRPPQKDSQKTESENESTKPESTTP